jgi:hypothetical protein
MATINPNLGLNTNVTVRPAQTNSVPDEAAPALPSDGLNVDFSKAKSAPSEKSSAKPAAQKEKAPAQEPQLCGTTAPGAPIVVGGVELAAADGGFALSNTGGLAQLETPKSPEFASSIDGCLANLAAPQHPEFADMLMGMQLGHLPASEADIRSLEAGGIGTKGITTITAEKVNWDKGADVVSNAQKFVIPVPQFEGGGEPLVYPAGAKDKDGNEIGGTPIKDWQGQPIGDTGVVFFNAKDQAWQAVKADGQGVVIMNQMTEEQGKAIMNKIGADPSKLTLEQFKEVLTFAATTEYNDKGEVTREGCKDMYNSDRDFISKKMNALETLDSGIPQYGMFRRDDRDVCKALFADGPGEFEAQTGGGVTVKQPIPEEGGILVRQPDGKVFLYRKVDLEVFEETYRLKDGSPVVNDQLPRHVA